MALGTRGAYVVGEGAQPAESGEMRTRGGRSVRWKKSSCMVEQKRILKEALKDN